MHPTLQLLERHQDELNASKIHWFDYPEAHPLIKTNDCGYRLNWDAVNLASLDNMPWPTNDLNILFMPKAKDRLNWWLSQILNSLKPSQKLWLVGENNSGIKSIAKRLKNEFNCSKIDSARHCLLIELTPLVDTVKTSEAVSFSVNQLNFSALPGVFSAGRLDKGSEVLLKVLPALSGQILEFGAGCGVLTAQLAAMPKVQQVDAVEIDLLAVKSAKINLADNQLTSKATIHWSAGVQNLPAKKYHAIVTNPPFHQGIKTAYGPTEDFFKLAHNWLKSGGKFIWVANDFLNYQNLLKDNFIAIEELVHERGFRVFSATRK